MLLGSFCFFVGLFFLRLPNLLLSLVTLEVLSFLVIFILFPFVSSRFVVILLFSVFVFLGVVGIVGFYLLLVVSGTDYIYTSTSLLF